MITLRSLLAVIVNIFLMAGTTALASEPHASPSCDEILNLNSMAPIESQEALLALPAESLAVDSEYQLPELKIRYRLHSEKWVERQKENLYAPVSGRQGPPSPTFGGTRNIDVPQFVNKLDAKITPHDFLLAQELFAMGQDPAYIRKGIRKALDDPRRIRYHLENHPEAHGRSLHEIFGSGVEVVVFELIHESGKTSQLEGVSSFLPSTTEIDTSFMKTQVERIRSLNPFDPPVRLKIYHTHPSPAPLSPSDHLLAVEAARVFKLITTTIAFIEYEDEYYAFYSRERYWPGYEL